MSYQNYSDRDNFLWKLTIQPPMKNGSGQLEVGTNESDNETREQPMLSKVGYSLSTMANRKI